MQDRTNGPRRSRLGLGLSGGDVAALVRRTEGRPAGLYLAALSASHAGDPRRFIEWFSASSRHVVDFFIDEVPRRQPADLQAFMTHCDALAAAFPGHDHWPILRPWARRRS